MKNFYEVVKDGAMVYCDDTFKQLEDLYRDFLNQDGPDEVEYQGSPLVFKELERHGGEGLGEDYYVVFSVTYMNETTNYKVNGWYASYNGYEFDDLEPYEVEYKEVCRMEWVAKS